MAANTPLTSSPVNNAAAPSVPAATSTLAPTKSVSALTEVSPSSDLAAITKQFTPDAFANGFSTLVGALVGAMLAYVLQRRFQRSLEHKDALTAGHRLMFSLLQQINTIVLIQRDYVQERNGEERNGVRNSLLSIYGRGRSYNEGRPSRIAPGGLDYHMQNGANGRMILFEENCS
jgi:hypothetical protein